MKKAAGITGGIVVIAAGAWLGATWYSGVQLEKERAVQLQRANAWLATAMDGMEMKLTELSYTRGFFSTDARYALVGPDKDGERIEFSSHAEHGPFPPSALAAGHWLPSLMHIHAETVNASLLAPVYELTKNQTPLAVDAVVGYDGKTGFKAALPAFDFPLNDLDGVFDGATFTGSFDPAPKALKLNGQSAGVRYGKSDKPEGALSIKGLALNVDGRLGRFGFATGSFELLADSIGSNDAGLPTRVGFKKLRYWGQASEDERFYRFELGHGAESLILNDQELGSQEIRLSGQQWDGAALRQALDTSRSIYGRLIGEYYMRGADSQEKAMQAIRDVWKPVLQAQPSLALDAFRWTTKAGQSQLSARLDLQLPPDDAPLTLDYLGLAVKKMQADLQLSRPMLVQVAESFARATPGKGTDEAAAMAQAMVDGTLAKWQADGVLTGQEPDLKGQLIYQQGQFQLNGKPTSLDQVLELLSLN